VCHGLWWLMFIDYSIFCAARLLFTLCFVFAIQPWRSIFFALGQGVTIAALIHLLLQAFTLAG
jgi:uncharacterized MAPEG superfamily protein